MNTSSAMPDNGFRVICCVVQDDSNVFKIKASVNDDVVDLKKLVFDEGKNSTFRDTDAKNLTLWKVSVL